jgi:hypothetical protein
VERRANQKSEEEEDQYRPNRDLRPEKNMEEGKVAGKFPQVICFKCGKSGHFSSACSTPKVCFICYNREHVVENCPEWKNTQYAAQYYGSANKGARFLPY